MCSWIDFMCSWSRMDFTLNTKVNDFNDFVKLRGELWITLGHFGITFDVWRWLWSHFEVTSASLLACEADFGITLGSLFAYDDDFVATLGSLCSHFWHLRAALATLWIHSGNSGIWGWFGITLGLLWYPFAPLGVSLWTFFMYFRIVWNRFDYEERVSRKYTFFQMILIILWYERSLVDHFGVTLALFLTSEDDIGVIGEDFGQTLDHVNDKKPTWADLGPPVKGKKCRATLRQGTRRGQG